jgi:hypothetical protein
MKGLSPKTEKVFNAIKQSSIFREYILIGGTALSIQMRSLFPPPVKIKNNP